MSATASTTYLKQSVLSVLRSNPDQTYRAKQIAQQLDINDDRQFDLFLETLDELEKDGIIRKEGRDKYQFDPSDDQTIGKLHVNPKGFGFVSVEGREEDLYVNTKNMGTALDGDTVRVKLIESGGKGHRQEAKIVEVIDRKRTKTAGTFHRNNGFGFVESDDQKLVNDVYVPGEAFNGAEDGDKVVVSIDRFDESKSCPEGEILKVIGSPEAPGTDVLSLALSQDMRVDFPEKVLRQAEKISTEIPHSEVEDRLDLRNKNIFTIDPEDAKDFDDAIHISQKPNGNLEVGVHIADVSHYVKEGTAIDDEALERATSVYLVDRVLPMLPEKLSNKVCSLRPNEDKLAYSCIMELDVDGRVVDHQIEETIIRSRHRFTYDEAQAIIDGDKSGHFLADDVQRANDMAQRLTKNRYNEGSVDFDTPEVRVVLDDQNHPVDIRRKERKQANRLIEEFMLLANKTVARHIAKDPQGARPFVYRVHDRPDPEKIQTLARYVKAFGHELPLKGGNVQSKDLNDFLQSIKGTPEQAVIEEAALRAMAKAIYDTENIGHYGLGFRYYTHFTSPIRRYPDLIVHRLLKKYNAGGSGANSQKLSDRCEHCSERERSATEAQRESIRLKQVEYMLDHVGDTFKGVVSGVTSFGVFVEISELVVEGLVHVRNLTDDYYEYDEDSYALIGSNKGRTIRVGQEVEVRVKKVDLEARRVDLVFT